MARGRPRKPTKLKILNGNPGKRDLDLDSEPQPAAGIPDCPDVLSAEAKAEWARVTADLGAIGLLCRVDRGELAAYCSAWGEFHHAMATLKREGRFITTGRGKMSHPAVAQLHAAWRGIKEFGCLYGLDPSSRSRLKVPPKDAKRDDFEAFVGIGS